MKTSALIILNSFAIALTLYFSFQEQVPIAELTLVSSLPQAVLDPNAGQKINGEGFTQSLQNRFQYLIEQAMERKSDNYT